MSEIPNLRTLKEQQDFYNQKREWEKEYNPTRMREEIRERRKENEKIVENFVVSELEQELNRLKKDSLSLIIDGFERELERFKENE